MSRGVEPFWLVWNPQGRSPVYRHGSLKSAQAEAARLARNNPGEEFYVLATVGRCKAVDVIWTEIDELPF